MMKKLILLLISISVVVQTNAQETDLHIVSSVGGSYQADNLSLDWTMGEVIVPTLEKTDLVLSQGFHQPSYQLVALHPISPEERLVEVFPNPFSDEISIKSNSTKPSNGLIEIYDIHGRKVLQKEFNGTEATDFISTAALPSGSYIMVVSFAHFSQTQSFHLVKM